MSGFCLLVELQREGSALQPVQQACLFNEPQFFLSAEPNFFVGLTLIVYQRIPSLLSAMAQFSVICANYLVVKKNRIA